MKRIITFLLIATMLFTFVFSASAATVDAGMNVSYSEDANGIVTVKVNMVGINNVSAVKVVVKYTSDYTLLTTGKEAFTKTSDKAANYTAVVNELAAGIAANAWSAQSLDINSAGNQVTVTRGKGTGTGNVDCTDATDFIEFYFKKADGVTLAASGIYMNNHSMSGTTYGSGTTTVKMGTSAANFAEDYVPNKPATTDKWETSAAPEGWTAPAKLEGEVRRVAVFGKNATAKALEANNYGVKFGANTYYGGATTEAVNAWAIVLVDTEGDLIKAGYEYTGTAFVGTTEWPVTVSAN